METEAARHVEPRGGEKEAVSSCVALCVVVDGPIASAVGHTSVHVIVIVAIGVARFVERSS